MNLKEALEETKRFIEIQAELVGVKERDIFRKLKEEYEIEEFVEKV